jgi:hypothetical protein
MSDSSRVQISYLKQAEKGTVDEAAFTEIRHTGGTFGAPQETARSDEIRGDAQRGATVRTGQNPEGAINMEFSAQTFDDLLEGFLRSAWSTDATGSIADAVADNTGSAFTTTAGDFTDEDITVGQWIFVSGFDTEGANGWFKVTSIAATTLGVTPAPIADLNAGGNSILFEGAYIRNGILDNYYAFQLEFLDLTNKLRLISDARIDQFSLSSNARDKVTGSFNFTGAKYALATAKDGDGTVTPAPETGILNTTDHATGVFIDGVEYDGCIMSYGLSANFNSRRQNCVGQLQSTDVKLGSLDLSGNISVYLNDTAWANMLAKYEAFTKFSLAFAFTDDDGNGYVFELPQIVLTNEPGSLPGPDSDVMLDFDWAGEPGTVGAENKTIQISRRKVA